MSRDLRGHLNSAETNELKNGNKNVFVVGDSMLNNISERGISGATTERINEKIDDILQSKPDIILIHAGTNDPATTINPLNNLRKILRKCNELSPQTKLAFSNIIVRKNKVNLEMGRKDINSRIKNFCQQNGIGYIDNSNTTENHLGMKKLHLNSKGNTAFAKNLINVIEH